MLNTYRDIYSTPNTKFSAKFKEKMKQYIDLMERRVILMSQSRKEMVYQFAINEPKHNSILIKEAQDKLVKNKIPHFDYLNKHSSTRPSFDRLNDLTYSPDRKTIASASSMFNVFHFH